LLLCYIISIRNSFNLHTTLVAIS